MNLKKIMLYYASGTAGALANSLALWLLGAAGVTAAMGIRIAPDLSSAWLYPRLVWGGLWGLIFFLPLAGKTILRRGFFLSLAPTLVQWFVVFPFKLDKDVMGLDLGILTPVLVVFVNAVWGWTTALCLRGVRS